MVVDRYIERISIGEGKGRSTRSEWWLNSLLNYPGHSTCWLFQHPLSSHTHTLQSDTSIYLHPICIIIPRHILFHSLRCLRVRKQSRRLDWTRTWTRLIDWPYYRSIHQFIRSEIVFNTHIHIHIPTVSNEDEDELISSSSPSSLSFLEWIISSNRYAIH